MSGFDLTVLVGLARLAEQVLVVLAPMLDKLVTEREHMVILGRAKSSGLGTKVLSVADESHHRSKIAGTYRPVSGTLEDKYSTFSIRVLGTKCCLDERMRKHPLAYEGLTKAYPAQGRKHFVSHDTSTKYAQLSHYARLHAYLAHAFLEWQDTAYQRYFGARLPQQHLGSFIMGRNTAGRSRDCRWPRDVVNWDEAGDIVLCPRAREAC